MDRDQAEPLDIMTLPELPTEVGMAGAMIEVEIGGQVCLESGVLIITSFM